MPTNINSHFKYTTFDQKTPEQSELKGLGLEETLTESHGKKNTTSQFYCAEFTKG